MIALDTDLDYHESKSDVFRGSIPTTSVDLSTKMQTALAILFVVCPLAALTFFVRLACAQFSNTVAEQVKKRPVIHGIWGLFALGGIMMVVWVLNPGLWPPDWLERRSQRRLLAERVQAAGGWDAVKRDCASLVENHSTEPFSWFRGGSTNPLPQALAALKPIEIRYYPPEMLRNTQHETTAEVIRIRLFGLPSTGGNAIPYFGLEVVCGTNASAYEPQRGSRGGVPGNRHSTFRKITDNVFEIY